MGDNHKRTKYASWADYLKAWKAKNPEKHLEYNKRNVIKTQTLKKQCVDYKGGKCAQCGFKRTISALDFHHINEDNKEFEISKVINRRTITTLDGLKEELDKCVLLCKNCHNMLHYPDLI